MPESWTCSSCGNLNAPAGRESAFASDKDFREQIADMQRVAQVTLGHCSVCGTPRGVRSAGSPRGGRQGRHDARTGSRRAPVGGALGILALNAILLGVAVWPELGGVLGERVQGYLGPAVVLAWVLVNALGLVWWWRRVRRVERVDQGSAPEPPRRPEPQQQTPPRPRWG